MSIPCNHTSRLALKTKLRSFKVIFDNFCQNSTDLESVCSDGRKVSFKSYLLIFYSANNLEVFSKSSTIFMEDDFETIMLLRDLLTSGEGHSEGNPRQTVMKLLAAAESLNINLTENFDIKNYTMNFTDFISGIDEIMKDSYEVSPDSEREYNMPTGEFIEKVDRIFTSTMKKDQLQFMLEMNKDSSEISLEEKEHEFQCKFCEKVFSTKKMLKRHSLCHTQFSCHVCGKGFRMQSLLTWHEKNEHDASVSSESSELESVNGISINDEVEDQKKVLQCKFCDKVFTTKKLLKRHSLCHTQYSCNICGKGFRMKSLLTWHEKNEHDMSVVSESSELDSFDYSAFDEKSIVESTKDCYKCEICGQRFRMSSLLARHWRVDHDVKSFCQPCDKSFENESLLRKHKLTKHSIISSMRQSFKSKVINQIEL